MRNWFNEHKHVVYTVIGVIVVTALAVGGYAVIKGGIGEVPESPVSE